MTLKQQKTPTGDWRYDALVAQVLDGDTVRLSVDLGFKVFLRVDVRLQGINAPEKSTASGKSSKAALETLLPMGQAVTVVTEKPSATDKYGRWLGKITTQHCPDVSSAMLARGFAKSWDGTGKKPT